MRKALRKVVIVIGFFLALGIADQTCCPDAEASYGVKDTLETIGISTGIGTVIGLSTIAFYEKPTANLKNALVGAGAGLIVGLGVAAYLLATASDSDEIDPEELLPPENRPNGTGKKPGKDPAKSDAKGKSSLLFQRRATKLASAEKVSRLLASVPATFAMRDSAHWAVAVQVLELRF